MNEKIKELAVKAQVEHCISHVRLQEFAELIVRECCLALWTEECHSSDLAFDEVKRTLHGSKNILVSTQMKSLKIC